MPDNNAEKPKIHIDDDWKAQAQREKERLAAEVEGKKPAEPAAHVQKGPPGEVPTGAARPGGAAGGQRELPPANFATLVSTLVTQAMFAMGAIDDPRTRQRYVDLPLAKHHIDMLAVLEDKTRGNLSDDERHLIDQALYEARMHYVEIAQRMSMI
jgi:hypothetical protein